MKITYRILMKKLRKVLWSSGMSPCVAVWKIHSISKQCDAFIFKGSRSISNAKELSTVVPPYPLIQYPRFTTAQKKKLEKQSNKRFINFKTCAKWEWAVTWWNPAGRVKKKLSRRENMILSKFSTAMKQACFGRKFPTWLIFTYGAMICVNWWVWCCVIEI